MASSVTSMQDPISALLSGASGETETLPMKASDVEARVLSGKLDPRQSELFRKRGEAEETLMKEQKALSAKTLELEEAEGKRIAGLEAGIRRTRAEQTVPEPEFKPSEMQLEDYRNLAGMLVGFGMLAGGSGRNGAMYALNSLNGMMKGYAEGRRDLFKNEQIKFDKQLRSIEATNKRVQRDFEDALAMLQTDREEGKARLKRIAAENGNGVMSAQLQLGRINDAIKTSESMNKSAEAFAQNRLKIDADTKAAEIKAAADLAKSKLEIASREQIAREEIAGRKEVANIQASAKAEKPLSGAEITKLQGLQSVVSGLQTLIKDFKPKFAGLGVFGFGADAQLEALRRGIALGLSENDARQAVRWWSRYNQLQAPNRHALFGATLTGNELTNYRSFTSQPSASAQSVKDNLQDQLNYTQNTFTQRVQNFSDTGYKVPQQVNIPDFWGTYQQATPAQSAAPPSVPQAAPSPAARSTTPRQAVPDRATWIAAAKPLNPTMTEDELGKAYDNKYGKKP